jgi:hypothetical protein
MMYPKSLQRIKGNKRKSHPEIKAKCVLNRHLINLRGPVCQNLLSVVCKGKHEYLTDWIMLMEITIHLRFYGTMTDNPSFLTRKSMFVTMFCGKSLNIGIFVHQMSLTNNYTIVWMTFSVIMVYYHLKNNLLPL